MVFKALKVEVIDVYKDEKKWNAAMLLLSVKWSGSWEGISKVDGEGGKVMWESSGGQGEPELEGCPSGPAWASTPKPEFVLLFYDFHQLFWH